MRSLGLIISLLVFLSLTSCGFQPRGNWPLAAPLHNLYLQSNEPYGQLTHNLRQFLRASGVHLAKTPQEASTVLEILNETTGQQLLTVSGTQQTRQYNLILTVTFQVTNPQGAPLYATQAVSEVRTIPISSNQILGGSNEANNLYSQMRQAIVFDIMNLLSSQNMTNAVNKP